MCFVFHYRMISHGTDTFLMSVFHTATVITAAAGAGKRLPGDLHESYVVAPKPSHGSGLEDSEAF